MATTNKKTPKKAEEMKTVADLQKELLEKRTELLEARRGHTAGELANPRIITRTKKDIARLLTAIRAAEEREKGRK